MTGHAFSQIRPISEKNIIHMEGKIKCAKIRFIGYRINKNGI